jgi:hypothetical protein
VTGNHTLAVAIIGPVWSQSRKDICLTDEVMQPAGCAALNPRNGNT